MFKVAPPRGHVRQYAPRNGAMVALVVRRIAAQSLAWCAGTRCWHAVLLLAILLATTTPGHAQMSGHGSRGGNRQQNTQQAPGPKPPPIIPEPWPRLDPGAVLCKSSEDLILYQARLEQRPDATTGAQGRNCRIVAARMPIQILDRDGLSRTHVVATDTSKQVGWTNAYLPAKMPSSASR